MQAGRMRHKLELLAPVDSSDIFGGARGTDSFKSVRVVWAELVSLKGSQRKEAFEAFPDFSAEFRIRDVHPVDNGWRCRQLGGMLYNITNVIPNEKPGYKSLICTRVNK